MRLTRRGRYLVYLVIFAAALGVGIASSSYCWVGVDHGFYGKCIP